MKTKMMVSAAAAFITSVANAQVQSTTPNIYSFYCDECYAEYERMTRRNEALNGPCCWDGYSVPCCKALGEGMRDALDFFFLCAETCENRPWWAMITDPRFSFEEFAYLLEKAQENNLL